ncbi:MAG: endonuclease/exonuclease/phosphatase family protein [Sphingorhabdus sp.]
MTIIHSLRWKFAQDKTHQNFVAERLLALKNALRQEVQGQTDERSLRLATWNIMHFGDGGGYQRNAESMLYIAEIIDHFDLVAIQEVNRNLRALKQLMKDHLGSGWDYIVTDTSGGNSGRDAGNDERLAFLYRKSKVEFMREAGEIVLPTGQEITVPNAGGTTRKVQFARTPFSVSFRSGWLKFRLCTVHIFFGQDKESSAKMEQRRAEIEKIAQFLADRQEDEVKAAIKQAKKENWVEPQDAARDSNYILLGDFNIKSPEHKTMKALESAGFDIPTAHHKTNLGSTHHYDQIAFKAGDPRFSFIRSGVFDMLAHVYRDTDAAHYVDHVKPESFKKNSKGKTRNRDQQITYFKKYYRRHQMSDHKLLWAEIRSDFSDEYIAEIING